jgi:two-component system sporulation sensor kinase A
VLWNLLGNAADAQGSGGSVRVRLWREDEQVHVVVEDDGPGIAPEDLPRIFDPFFTTKERGTGLGLVISRKMITRMSGTISLESAPDRGTVVTITLPERRRAA